MSGGLYRTRRTLRRPCPSCQPRGPKDGVHLTARAPHAECHDVRSWPQEDRLPSLVLAIVVAPLNDPRAGTARACVVEREAARHEQQLEITIASVDELPSLGLISPVPGDHDGSVFPRRCCTRPPRRRNGNHRPPSPVPRAPSRPTRPPPPTCSPSSPCASCTGSIPRPYLLDIIHVLPYWPRNRYLELAPKYWTATRARISELRLLRALDVDGGPRGGVRPRGRDLASGERLRAKPQPAFLLACGGKVAVDAPVHWGTTETSPRAADAAAPWPNFQKELP